MIFLMPGIFYRAIGLELIAHKINELEFNKFKKIIVF